MARLRIVVPVLDEGVALKAWLATLRPLRERGAEVVVVDGGSTDETWAIACQHADRVLHAPRGRAAQMNAGARGASADVLLFLHADTVLPPDAERSIARALAGGAAWGRFDVRLDSPRPLLRLVGRLMSWRSRWTGIATGDQAIFVCRDVFQQVGGYAELPLMEDIALSARLRRLSAPAIARPPVLTSARRWQRHGALRTIGLMWRLRWRYFVGADPQALADAYGYARRPPPAQAALAILAKAPVPGLAKTRLGAGVGAVRAARIQRGLTLAALHAAQQAALGPVTLWCAPDTTHRFFRALARRRGVALAAQPGGDLGQRLAHIADAHFHRSPNLPLLLLGTDCPLLSPGRLQAAARALAEHDAVMIPAEDGGYVLLGLRRALPAVFEGIAWSTPEVAAQTRQRLHEAGVRWCELAPLWDIDEPADWQRWQNLVEADA